MSPVDRQGGEARQKAYYVPLKGTVVRTFLVRARSAAHARELMQGSRRGLLAVDDEFEEVGLGRVRRAHEEDVDV